MSTVTIFIASKNFPLTQIYSKGGDNPLKIPLILRKEHVPGSAFHGTKKEFISYVHLRGQIVNVSSQLHHEVASHPLSPLPTKNKTLFRRLTEGRMNKGGWPYFPQKVHNAPNLTLNVLISIPAITQAKQSKSGGNPWTIPPPKPPSLAHDVPVLPRLHGYAIWRCNYYLHTLVKMNIQKFAYFLKDSHNSLNQSLPMVFPIDLIP